MVGNVKNENDNEESAKQTDLKRHAAMQENGACRTTNADHARSDGQQKIAGD